MLCYMGQGNLVYIYLVGAPVPRGYDRQPKSHPGPGQVSRDWISEEMHGIGSGQVALGTILDGTAFR